MEALYKLRLSAPDLSRRGAAHRIPRNLVPIIDWGWPLESNTTFDPALRKTTTRHTAQIRRDLATYRTHIGSAPRFSPYLLCLLCLFAAILFLFPASFPSQLKTNKSPDTARSFSRRLESAPRLGLRLRSWKPVLRI